MAIAEWKLPWLGWFPVPQWCNLPFFRGAPWLLPICECEGLGPMIPFEKPYLQYHQTNNIEAFSALRHLPRKALWNNHKYSIAVENIPDLNDLPECRPILSFSVSPGRCRMWKLRISESKWRANDAISAAWRFWLRIGNPLATMYASPIVSTLYAS